jgi:UDP:flavonoid glycosyltransferase YjiC (YdhE family)
MRVALALWPASAHLYPFVPLAWALRAAGHEVVILSHPSIGAEASACGLPFTALCTEAEMPPPTGPAAPWPEAREAVQQITRALQVPSDELGRWTLVSQGFLASTWDFTPYGGSPSDPLPAMDNMVAFFRQWHPDLVVWDPCMPGAAVAARAVGAKQARLYGTDYFGWFLDTYAKLTSHPGAPQVPNPVAETVRPMAERYDVEVDRDLLYGQWTIDMVPPGMNFPVNTRKIPMRWIPYTGQTPMADWLYPIPERPRIALCFSASLRAFLKLNWRFLADVLEALASLDVEVVATLDKVQLADIPTIPPNVRAIDYVPLDYLVPTCSALIHHGDLGSMVPAYYGVPQLIIDFLSETLDGEVPDFGETAPSFRCKLAPIASRYVTSFGAGEVLNLSKPDHDTIRDQVTRVLTEPSFARGAARLRQDALAAPSPADLVPTLEKLTAAAG